MAKLSYDDLKQIKKDTAKSMRLRISTPAAKISVHMGSCGIKAGARDILHQLLDIIDRSPRQDVQVLVTGCDGNCKNEPKVTVQFDDKQRQLFENVNNQTIDEITTRLYGK